MPNVLIRDLPDDVHARLKARAAARGQSLQAFLTQELVEAARRTTAVELGEQVEAMLGRPRRGLSREAILDAIDAEREERVAHLVDVVWERS